MLKRCAERRKKNREKSSEEHTLLDFSDRVTLHHNLYPDERVYLLRVAAIFTECRHIIQTRENRSRDLKKPTLDY